jgi:Xaa-Pro aminopeptidase
VQKALYEVVLAAQAAAIRQVKPGNHWNAPHIAAIKTLTRGLARLGILKGRPGDLVRIEAYRRFYMHRTGHWLGLDVHDAGEYKRAGVWRSLVPGMTLTVEPGLYIRAADDVPAPLHDIGVRIEDDVAVTAQGCEVLTAAAPKSVDAIEALMRERRGRD